MDPDRIELAQIPTRLEKVKGIFPNGTLFVKRDDLTGSTLTGNKIRKLEYLFYEAQSLGKSTVLTCGGIQSNHCRATAIAAAQLGMKSILYLRTDDPPSPGTSHSGNLKLCHQVGAEIRYISVSDYQDRTKIMDEAAGEDGYVIPEGGSNALGAWGYIRAVDEMIGQWDTPPSSIVVATGSGGTLAGLLIGLRRRKLSIPTHGICVCDDAPYFQEIVSKISQEATSRWPDLPIVLEEEVSIVEGYMGRGYSLSTPEESADITNVAKRTGLVLDPVYTGKAFRALLKEPDRFGDRPLFIHTGGVFGFLA